MCCSALQDIANLRGFRIASLNVKSLLKHIEELRFILTNFPLDMLAINESKIDDQIPDSKYIHQATT